MSRMDDFEGLAEHPIQVPDDAASVLVPDDVREGFGPSSILVDHARFMLASRRRRRSFFPKGLFRETAFDMLLQLFVCLHEGGDICVKQLILVSGDPATSALRKIDRLQSMDLIVRRPDPVDHRRVLVELTAHGHEALSAYIHDRLRRARPGRG